MAADNGEALSTTWWSPGDEPALPRRQDVYEGGYNHTRMTSWTVPKPREQTSKKPKFREGSTFFIANDKGYLKPDVPRSKENPWGTFLGTWDMPQHIPQPRPNLTARNPTNAAQLIKQVKASPLYRASNGFGLQPMFLVRAVSWSTNVDLRAGAPQEDEISGDEQQQSDGFPAALHFRVFDILHAAATPESPAATTMCLMVKTLSSRTRPNGTTGVRI
ncbi:protein Flattop [Rhinoraja longicauda]